MSRQLKVHRPVHKGAAISLSHSRINVRRQSEVWVRVKLLRLAICTANPRAPELPDAFYRLAELLPKHVTEIAQVNYMLGRASISDIADLVETHFLSNGDMSGPGRGYTMTVKELYFALDVIWANRMIRPVTEILSKHGQQLKEAGLRA